MKRELALHAPTTRKYILLHDTTVDGDAGEAVRHGWCPVKMATETGISETEIVVGLWPAVMGVTINHCKRLNVHKT